jgi:tripartite-type tricarboxylate transporter receptor subunit TctC
MTYHSRRHLLKHATCLSGLALAPRAFAQSSNNPVGRMLVGYPPGGTIDVAARRLADSWRTQGRSFIVENRSGAAGRIATASIKREPSDGSVVLCTHTSALTIYPHYYRSLAYNPATDLRPVAMLASSMPVLAISSAVPADVKDLAGYVRWLKANETSRLYASCAAGSLAQFLGFRFSQEIGVALTHVGYRGCAPALQDLLGGQIPAYLGYAGDFVQYQNSTKVRLLGATGERRSRFLPDVPTFAEQGFKTVVGIETYGVFLPPGASDATVAATDASIRNSSGDGALANGLAQTGLEVAYQSTLPYVTLIASERQRWAPIVASSGFRSDE